VVNAAFNPHSTLYPHHADYSLPFSEMAMNEKSEDAALQNKDKILDSKDDNSNGSGIDAEQGTKSRFGSNSTAGPRIAPVLPHLSNYDFGSDDSGSDVLGQQLELEKDNAIQYRTCSWQKV